MFLVSWLKVLFLVLPDVLVYLPVACFSGLRSVFLSWISLAQVNRNNLIIWASSASACKKCLRPDCDSNLSSTDIKYSVTLSVYRCLTDVCDICWMGRKELWFLYRIRRTLFYPPRCHFRQLWTQKWQKAAAPLTIKPWAEPLIVPV